MDLEAFELVILRRPATRPDCDEQTAQRLQDEHQAYLTWLHEAGHTVASGPLGDQDDESLRGLVFYRTGSLDEALATEVMTWCCMPGTMKLPGRILHIPDE